MAFIPFLLRRNCAWLTVRLKVWTDPSARTSNLPSRGMVAQGLTAQERARRLDGLARDMAGPPAYDQCSTLSVMSRGGLRYTVDVSSACWRGPSSQLTGMTITKRTVPRPPNYCAAPDEVVRDVAIAWSTALPPRQSCACLILSQEISTLNPAHTYLIASTVEFAVRCMAAARERLCCQPFCLLPSP